MEPEISTITSEITRDEFEMLAAEVATAKQIATETYALKSSSFQYATLVDSLNEQAAK
jgi:fibronectin type 3 domain-containing protein